ncbi:MAG: YidB family protein [Methylococcaceae bacterium]
MDINAIIQMGAQLFKAQLDKDHNGQLDVTEISTALTGLLSNGQGGLDIASLVKNMQGGDLIAMAASWLGDGPNQAVQPGQLAQILGDDKIAAFAKQLGLSPEKALSGLTEAVPAVVDQSSTGGSLLDMVGGVSGAINLASKLFAR